MNEKWITVKEAAMIRKCSERTIITLIQKKELQAKREGRKWLVLLDIPQEDLAEEQPKDSALDPQLAEVISELRNQLNRKDEQIGNLQKQLAEKDTSVEESRQRTDTIIMQLTRQLEQSQKMLSAHEEPWYRKWFRKSQRT
jgi:excisionase family DNA binding protein